MYDEELVVVHTFSSQSEADVARSALDAAGIGSMIQADTVGGMRPHIAWAGDGFQILVREDDVAAAREVLNLPAKQIP
ncbi:MAG TPA: DUF2007 domain-containing protein [Vicinamibacterales bacterium]|nr:DUF2007 domain-containing protein [Vicinamibacterales bacterium]